jgi:predicted transcriptional regulator
MLRHTFHPLLVSLNMQVVELKQKIIHHLEFADERMLRMIHALLEADVNSDVYELSETELALLEEAEEDIKAGRLLSNEQVENQVAAWLSTQK